MIAASRVSLGNRIVVEGGITLMDRSVVVGVVGLGELIQPRTSAVKIKRYVIFISTMDEYLFLSI